MFTLKQLRAALALAETGHFGRAAERCHITQPALSQQIRLLEEACGTALFDRRGKSVRPTPFGREFVVRARQAVEAAGELETFAATRDSLPDRPLRFGLIPTVAPYLLPTIFPLLRQRFPALAFTISERRTDTLLAELDDASIDLALIATDPPEDGPRLAVAPLFEDGFVLATGRSDVATEPVRLADLPAERLLLLDEGHCFRDQALAACGLNAEVDRSTFAATSLSTIVEFVANGQGVTLLPEIALRKEAADARIRIRRLDAPGAARTLALVWRAGSPFAETFTAIAETIREAAGLTRPAPAAA
ncbi:MAG: hydrogen peroxide-inducible genes activator [Devosia sp.]|nr:hydrogen peroxide-inducible genes activator [Devosia sp.]